MKCYWILGEIGQPAKEISLDVACEMLERFSGRASAAAAALLRQPPPDLIEATIVVGYQRVDLYIQKENQPAFRRGIG